MSDIRSKFISHNPQIKIVYSGKKLGNTQARFSSTIESDKNIKKLLNNLRPGLSLVEIDAIGGDSIKLLLEEGKNFNSNSLVCDGLITNNPSLALGLYAADCIPMVMTANNCPFFGLIHVGLSGADLGIHLKAVDLSIKYFKIRPRDLVIYLGPHIKKPSYVFEDIGYKNLDHNKWQKYIGYKKDLHHINLTRFVVDNLTSLGVSPNNISISAIDTGHNVDYFSHRRSSTTGETEGRNGFMCAAT